MVTSDLALADRIRSTANHGRSATDRYLHDRTGRNSRLDTLQAALLSTKLPWLDAGNARRAAAMAAYREMLPQGCTPVSVQPGAEPVYHLAVIQVDHRAEVGAALTAAGIGWGVHYPIPCHLQTGYAFLGYREGAFPRSEEVARRELSLPIYPEMTGEQIEAVARALHDVCAPV